MAGPPLPPELVARVRAVAERPQDVPPARDAATVVLVRDAPAGLEAYLLRRVRQMAFAGGMHVFPGGSVDPADGDDLPWSGPDPEAFATAFSCSTRLARALVSAAVREVFEESGVLLAGPDADAVVDDVSTDDWEADRQALESRSTTLPEVLRRRGLVLRADLLRPFAHWITPEVEPKRFDTRFFLARVPEGQVCRDVGGEADLRLWVRPADALESRLPMLPPTAVALRDLADAPDVEAALAAPREVRPVLPRFRLDGDDVVLLMPGDAGYDDAVTGAS